MKGLLIKDLKLLKMNKMFFLILMMISILLLFIQEQDASFFIGFLTIISAMFTLNTISYDEYNNGYPFLFTLPISRKLYAQEKYVFGIATSICAWLAATVLVIIRQSFISRTSALTALLIYALMYLFIGLLMLAVMIPTQLKFGPDKGRIAMIIITAIAFSLGAVGVEIFSMLNLANFISSLSIGVIGLLIVCLITVTLLISVRISIHIMEKKQF